MKLSDLDRRRGQYKVILVQTPADKLSLFLYDKVKADYGCTQNTIVTVKDKTDIAQVKEIAYVDSFISDKWLVTIDFSKDKSLGLLKDLLPIMYESNTIVFFCTANNYKTFKTLSDSFKKKGITEVVSFYLNRLNSADFQYLYNAYVTPQNKLSKNLYTAVYQGYSSNVSAIMDLFTELRNGTTFESQKDIADVCGVGNNSVENFVFSLLKQPSLSEQGTKIVLKNRLKAGFDLASVYGFGKLQNYMRNCVSCLRDIKVLRVSGVVYKTLINLPDGYDEAKLARYQRYIWRLNEIPLSRILRLGLFLDERLSWTNDLDFIHFIYAYLLDEMRYEVKPYQDKTLAEKELQAKIEREEKKERERRQEEEKYELSVRLDYIKKYGVIEGKRLFEQDKQMGLISYNPEKESKKTGTTKKSSAKAKISGAELTGAEAAQAFLTWVSSDKGE